MLVFVQSNLSVGSQLSIYGVIVVKKSSSREGKFTFYEGKFTFNGWGYYMVGICWTKFKILGVGSFIIVPEKSRRGTISSIILIILTIN